MRNSALFQRNWNSFVIHIENHKRGSEENMIRQTAFIGYLAAQFRQVFVSLNLGGFSHRCDENDKTRAN